MSTVDPIVEAVRAKLLSRSQVGITKYGVTLDRDDLSTLDWLRHAQEESLDHANYLEVLIQREERRMNDPICPLPEPTPELRWALEQDIAEVLHDCRPQIQVLPQASPTRTLRIDPHTKAVMRPLEPGEELCVVNESGHKVAVRLERSPTVPTLRNLIAELERERDTLRAALHLATRVLQAHGLESLADGSNAAADRDWAKPESEVIE